MIAFFLYLRLLRSFVTLTKERSEAFLNLRTPDVVPVSKNIPRFQLAFHLKGHSVRSFSRFNSVYSVLYFSLYTKSLQVRIS